MNDRYIYVFVDEPGRITVSCSPELDGFFNERVFERDEYDDRAQWRGAAIGYAKAAAKHLGCDWGINE